MSLTPLILQNASLLRALVAQSPAANVPALAAATGRDVSNLRKSIIALEAEGLVRKEPHLDITDAGRDAVAALDRADGTAAPSGPADAGGVREIPLHLIDNDPILNPREIFDDEKIEELTESVREKGVLQPILLRPAADPSTGRFRVVAGERRWRAATKAGLAGIPALVRELTDEEALEIALIENIQRDDLKPIEEARTFKRILDSKRAIDPDFDEKNAKEHIAQVTKRTVRWVEQRIQLLRLSEKDQQRMLLPKGDPKHLNFDQARYLVQQHEQADAAREQKKLKPAELLVMAEIADAAQKHPIKVASWWYSETPTEIDYAYEDKVLDALIKRRAVSLHRGHSSDPRTFVTFGWGWSKAVVADQLPGFKGAKRAQALQDLRRAVLGEKKAKEVKDGAYAMPWLNGPFKLDPKLEKEAKKRAKAEAEREAAREAERAKQEEEKRRIAEEAKARHERAETVLPDLRAFEADAAAMDHDTRTRRFAQIVADYGLQLPLTVGQDPKDTAEVMLNAEGEVVRGYYGHDLEVLRRISALAINMLAGQAAYSGPDIVRDAPPADPDVSLDEPAFLGVVAARFKKAAPEISDEAAGWLANRALREMLVEEGIEFGDPDWDWAAQGAERFADNEIDNWEDGRPPAPAAEATDPTNGVREEDDAAEAEADDDAELTPSLKRLAGVRDEAPALEGAD